MAVKQQQDGRLLVISDKSAAGLGLKYKRLRRWQLGAAWVSLTAGSQPDNGLVFEVGWMAAGVRLFFGGCFQY